jgi:hypothetical protein
VSGDSSRVGEAVAAAGLEIRIEAVAEMEGTQGVGECWEVEAGSRSTAGWRLAEITRARRPEQHMEAPASGGGTQRPAATFRPQHMDG